MKKKTSGLFQRKKIVFFALLFSFFFLYTEALTAGQLPAQEQKEKIAGARQINSTTVEVRLEDNRILTFDFYGENIFRLFLDPSGRILRDPEASPEARILTDTPRKPVSNLILEDKGTIISISTERLTLRLDKESSLFNVIDRENGVPILEETAPILFGEDRVTLSLKEDPQEYFYGGGVQNGRFSHKGTVISIENQNSWTDGGVASPTPFYWSTRGYGVLWHTFQKGKYDFGATEKGVVKLYHETDYADVFFMVDSSAAGLLNDYYQLTGHPVLLPKFGFYEGHLNAYNRDYWTPDENGILFEDGKRYRENQKDNGGIRESLNGEKNNYPFSARAVIDRYLDNDLPLGWLLPNDGYGAGYGQTGTIDGNIANLKSLADYAHGRGVQIGLWTQSDLHPKPGVDALLQRDIVKEVRDAGVRVLKTDVAWVGAGYSFGLNGISDVSQIIPYYGNNSRPFIITLDGWAGTQRYASVWTGDQTGGEWEYIRFHIPTYLGSGLSGQPNITSDMDGIFGGKNTEVNVRDFQWKTFTPMQLNMDGWGANPKYPQALGEPATSINRFYLKLKSELLPYAYSIARQAVDGLPMIRPLFLEYPNAYTQGKATQYQFMYGPSFLVAPIYRKTEPDEAGNDLRNGIYLPEGNWIDYFSGELFAGGRVINQYEAPLWKLPVFVKEGAILLLANPNNNPQGIDRGLRIYELYPAGLSSFTEYDDDGETEAYKAGRSVTTLIESNVDAKGKAVVTIRPAQGDFNGFVKEKATLFKVNMTEKPRKVSARIGNRKIKLQEVASPDALADRENVFCYDPAPELNRFATKGSAFETVKIVKNPQLLVKLERTDITAAATELSIEGYRFAPVAKLVKSGALHRPEKAVVTEEHRGAYTLEPSWEPVENADYYEIELNGVLYSTIRKNSLLLEGLEAETDYGFKLRAVNREGSSDWTECSARTKANPLEFALRGISGEASVPSQSGSRINRLFNFDESDLWHTKWDTTAVPFQLVIDLKTINQLDKFHYLPRIGAGNGTILKGKVSYGMDGENWTEAGPFEWKRNDETKVFRFDRHPTARYLRIEVTEATGNFGSGREIYVFKVPNTASYLPGDINNDGKIDRNDLTSYLNYTGLKSGDADFEGYISNGDLNRNGRIDAYDISAVATLLDEGAQPNRTDPKVGGTLRLQAAKQTYAQGDTVEITVKGLGLRSVNALSFALPYDPALYEFIGVTSLNVERMDNLTNDRLHTDQSKVLYPTFVNVGDKATLEGDQDLFVLKFRAKRKLRFDLKATGGILVDKALHSRSF